jgi:hypothetical protein
LLGKPKGKRALGRSRHGWEDGMRMDLMEISWEMQLIQLALIRDWWWAPVNMVITSRLWRHGIS